MVAIEFVEDPDRLVVHVPAPLFYVVWAVRHGDEEFRLQGIFSKADDAEAMRAQLEADKTGLYIGGTAAVDRMTMEQIKDALAEQRLGELNDTIRALAGVPRA
jgi:hypothetical protein